MRPIKWLLISISVWFLLYCWEYANNRWILTSVPSQFLLCWFFFLNAYISVPHEEYRKIVGRFTKSEIFSLGEGVYFMPFVWWWGEVFIPKEFREEKSNINLNFDSTKNTFRSRTIGLKEDLAREYFFPFIFGRGIWILIVTGGLSYGLNVKLIPYLKNETGIVNFVAEIFGKNKQESSNQSLKFEPKSDSSVEILSQKLIEKEKTLQELRDSFLFATKIDSASVLTDSATVFIDSAITHKIKKPINPNRTTIKKPNPERKQSNQSEKDFLPTFPNDDHMVKITMTQGGPFVEIFGFFISNSYNYPKVVVEGESSIQDGYRYFTVDIIRLDTKDFTYLNIYNIELRDYVNFIKSNKFNFNERCYRNIKVNLKNQYIGKINWMIIDYGDTGVKIVTPDHVETLSPFYIIKKMKQPNPIRRSLY